MGGIRLVHLSRTIVADCGCGGRERCADIHRHGNHYGQQTGADTPQFANPHRQILLSRCFCFCISTLFPLRFVAEYSNTNVAIIIV